MPAGLTDHVSSDDYTTMAYVVYSVLTGVSPGQARCHLHHAEGESHEGYSVEVVSYRCLSHVPTVLVDDR